MGEYILGYSTEESQRLDLQHAAYKTILGGQLLSRDVEAAARRGEISKVLDVGTGTGIWCHDALAELKALKTNEGQYHIVGSDVAESEQWGQHGGASTTFIKADLGDAEAMAQIGKDHGPFDLIHSRLMIIPIKDGQWESYLATISNLLRPGGYVQLEETDFGFSQSCRPERESVEPVIIAQAVARGVGGDPMVAQRLAHYGMKSGFSNVLKTVHHAQMFTTASDGTRISNTVIGDWVHKSYVALKTHFLKVRQLPNYHELLDQLPSEVVKKAGGRPQDLLKDEAEYEDHLQREHKVRLEDPLWHVDVVVTTGQKLAPGLYLFANQSLPIL